MPDNLFSIVGLCLANILSGAHKLIIKKRVNHLQPGYCCFDGINDTLPSCCKSLNPLRLHVPYALAKISLIEFKTSEIIE